LQLALIEIWRGGRNHGGGGGWKTVELKETKVCFKRGNKQWRAEEEEEEEEERGGRRRSRS